MEIHFKSKALRRLCEESKHAVRTLGPDVARKLRRRLSELSAAQTVFDLHAGRPHRLTGGRAGQIALSLAKGSRLVVSITDNPPLCADGRIDWTQVTEIRIQYIGDYHE